MKVLLLEDELGVQQFIIAIIKTVDSSAVIDAVQTGEDALRLYRDAGPYDLLITDFGHPGALSGITLIRTIRTMDPAQRVVLQTGNPEENIAVVRQEYPDIPVLEKPWKAAQLIPLLEAAGKQQEKQVLRYAQDDKS
jgi:DNA-binding NtrC family response regulator